MSNDQAAGDPKNRKAEAEEVEDEASKEKKEDQNNEDVDGSFEGGDVTLAAGIAVGEGIEKRYAAERIDDGEKGEEGSQRGGRQVMQYESVHTGVT